ncbi:DUF4188 domain-containing protein [Streptomyces sp. SPB162]|uniref:DUF4188 domain-containing protein n=1 Tax=Streptomyces sp. SPB162 TaxID=2940560 RepID=UPI0024068528|nr:DUF4188 domain-containing protein [Streptomyces sp. SPB162]
MGAELIEGRVTAAAEGDLVVFVIGMRINNFWALRSWWPVFTAMPRMLKELSREKDSGLLGFRLRPGMPRVFEVIQYWESREKLLAYAAAPDAEHRPAWTAFNRRARAGKGRVGIFHETYVVPAGGYESIYVDMPAYGLGEAAGVVPVGRRGESAKARLAYRAG